MVKESKSEFDTVCVNVTASLQYSPHKTVDDGTLESILGIVNDKDHLRRNIHDVTIGNIRIGKCGGLLIMNMRLNL